MFRFAASSFILFVSLSCLGCGSSDGVAVIDTPGDNNVSTATQPPAPKQLQLTERVSRLIKPVAPKVPSKSQEQWMIPKEIPSIAIKSPDELGPVWKVERDGQVPAYTIKEDLNYLWPNLSTKGTPVLACLRGPFGLKPVVDQTEGGLDTKNPSPVDVIDLRTGELTGKFSHKIPLDQACRLSPDGKVLVGPTNEDLRFDHRKAAKEMRTLHVWNEGEDESKTSIEHANGPMLWFGFVGRREVAVLTRTNGFNGNYIVKDCIEFFNVETGTLRTKLEIPYECSSKLDLGNTNLISRSWMYDVVAASPRGKYLAVIGPERLMLVDRATAELKGVFSMPALAGNRATVRFSDDASRLVVMALGTYPWRPAFTGCHLHIFELNAEDGSCLAQREVLGPDLKRMSSDVGDLRIFDGNPQWVSQQAIVMGGFGERPLARASSAKVIYPDSRVASTTGFQELIRMLDAGPALVVKKEIVSSRGVYSVVAVERDSFLSSKSSTANSYGSLGNPQLLVTNLSKNVVADEQLKEDSWVPVVAASDSIVCNFKDVEFDPSALFARTAKSGYMNLAAGSLAWQTINPETIEPIGSPLELLNWGEGNIKNEPTGASVFAVSKSGEQLAFIDPMRHGSLYIVSVNSPKRIMFHSSLKAIDWCGFLDSDTLLLAGDGRLSLCEVGESKVNVTYATDDRGYSCFAMHPDHKYLAASRLGCVDIVDATSGKAVNRMMLGEKNFVRYFSFSPSGKYLVAACKEEKDAYNLSELYVWDMTTGEQLKAGLECSTVAWVGPDLFLVGSPNGSLLCDLRFGNSFLAFAFPEHVDNKALKVSKLATSIQGGVWGKIEGEGGWKVMSACRGSRKSEIPFLASDRKLVELATTPIAIEMNLGKTRVGKKHGQSLAGSLQKMGYQIGKGGYTLKVKFSESVSDLQIEMERGSTKSRLSVPRVKYSWALEGDNRTVIWKGVTFGDFDPRRSRYHAGGSEKGTKFDFGSQDMSEAVVSEILEQGNGLEIPKDFPRRLMVGGGETSIVPLKLPWATGEAPANDVSSAAKE
ncbi:MAG: hypothetical protein U0930_14325 [Pirellulales bacterium]